MDASLGMLRLALLLQLCCVTVVTVTGEFLYFKPGLEYHYKFVSNAKVKGLDTFGVNGRVAYSSIAEDDNVQELHLRIVHLSMGSKEAGSNVNALDGWDFSRWFSFNLTRRGEIPLVTYDPRDDNETLAFKKGFAALLASKLHGEDESEVVRPTKDGWTYDVTEHGHEGVHNATYRVKRNANGEHVFTKIRKGHPVEHAKANYTKTIHYNQESGIIHSVQVKEDFSAMQKPSPGFDPKSHLGTSKVEGSFRDINLPEMRAFAIGHLKFLYQQPAQAFKKPTYGLKVGSIHIVDSFMTDKPKITVDEVHKFIHSNLTCMRWEPSKGSTKQINCFRGLSTALDLLPEEEMLKLASNYLSPDSTFYSRDRQAILDAMSTVNAVPIQKRLVELVLLHPAPEVDMMHRYLIHIAGMEEAPCSHVVNALKSLAFQPEKHPILQESVETYHRALLTLGGVAKTLARNGQEHEAQVINEAITSMLGVHDPGFYRARRSLLDEDQAVAEDHEKVVLLEALGNMGMVDCYEVIVSHVNDTNSPWVKRSALHALRHFHSDQVADVMMMRAFHDEDETVRYEASRHYAVHPKANPQIAAMLKEANSEGGQSPGQAKSLVQGHHRHRRSTRSEVLDLNVKSPSVDWTKIVGSKEIGASFGANMKNEIDFKTGLLTSEMTVDIVDEAFARVNLGFMNANVEILNSRMCFKGKAEYGVNMLQEYDSSETDRLSHLYDSLKANVNNAIVQSLTRFRTIIDSSTQLGNIINAYADAIEDLPDKVLHLGDSALTALETLGHLDSEEMPSFVAPLWRLANKVINIYNDIKNDVMGFYMKLLDTTVVIPYGSKQVFNSVSDIISTMDDFNDDPKSAMATVSDNTVLIGNQITSMLSALQEAKEKAFFNRKIKPYWWNMKQEKDEMNQMAAEATAALNQQGANWVSVIINDDLKEFSDGRLSLSQLRQQVVNSLSSIPNDLISPFASVSDLGDDLQKAVTDAVDLLEDMKNAYEDLRIGVKTAQEMVNRVFGPKFNRNFPKEFRLPDGPCQGNGMYVSSLGHTLSSVPEYTRKGIDLVVSIGDTIVAPFAGYVMRNQSSEREVILTVNAGLLSDVKIYIENINPAASILYPDDPDYLPNFVAAGDTLGTAARSYCIQHIHVSMQKEDRAFIDPSPYLQARTVSLPTWTQQCDDYKFLYKGVTVAASSMVGSPGRQNNNTSPTRTGSSINDPAAISSSYDPANLVDQDIRNSAKLGYQMKNSINTVTSTATGSTDEGLQKLINKPWVFVGNYNLKDLKVGSLASFLVDAGYQTSLNRLHSVFQGIQSMLDYQPCLNPHQMSDDKLREQLRVQGKNSTGTRPEMVDRFVAREDRCMSLSLGFPEDMYCKADPQCMGVECCLTIKLFMYKKNYRFYTRYDPCTLELIVGINNVYEYSIGPNLDMDDIFGGFSDLTLNTGIVETNLNAELILKMSLEKSDTQITLSASAGFCRANDVLGTNCLVFVTVLDRAIMPLPVCGPAPLRKLTFRTVNLQSELRNQKEKFSEDSKRILSEEVESTVTGLLSVIPCLSSDLNNATNLPCPRPDKMTQANLIEALSLRGLSTSGNKAALVARLEQSDRTCHGGNYSIPPINDTALAQKAYLTVSDDCRTLEACVDFTYQNFPVSVHSSLRLDECAPSMTVAFEECSQDMVLFSTNLNTTGRLKLTDNFIVDYKIQQDLPVSEYIFDLSMKVQVDTSGSPVVDDTLVQNLRIPIPVCQSTDYNLPVVADTFSTLANTFGGQLSTDMVDYLFRMLHLDGTLTSSCTLPSPVACVRNISVSSYVAQSFQAATRCEMDPSCLGISCCIAYNFISLPLVNANELKDMPFQFKFDPCDNMKVTVTFGNFFQQEQLLDYDFDTEKTVSIGIGENTGDSAPIIIRYKVARLFQTTPIYDEAFLVDASVHVGIPMDGTIYQFPTGGLTLMQNERIEVCPAANTSSLAAFDLNSFAASRGQNTTSQLNQGTVQMIINEFGLTPQLKKTQCNIAKSPYIPNLRGWRDDCDSSLFNLPANLGPNTVCHMSSSCTRVDCCYYSPLLDMSFNAFFDLNVCNFYIQGGIENKVYPIRYLLNDTNLDWTVGVNGTFEISNAILLEYNVRKPDNVNFVLDVILKLCLGNSCQDSVSIYHDTRVPQMNCLAASTQSLREVSFQFWKWSDCTLPSASHGCQIALPSNYTQNCVLTGGCKTIHCCQPSDLVIADKELEFTFTSEVCQARFSYTLEEKSWTRSFSDLPGISNRMIYVVESIGNAINLTLGVRSEATGLTVMAELSVCTTTNSVTSCTIHVLLNDTQIYDPTSVCSPGRRRKRSVTVDTTTSRDVQMLALINNDASTADIESHFAQLEQTEANKCTQMKTSATGTVSEISPKAILDAMGDRNPTTVRHCNDSSILSYSIEGANQIASQLNTTADIPGRTNQLYIPGRGLTQRGITTLAHKIANMTLGELTSYVMAQDSMQPELVIELLEDMRQLLYSLYSDAMTSISGGGVSDQFTSSDMAFSGSFSQPNTNEVFMKKGTAFMVGGLVPMNFRFATQISYGMDLTMSAHAMHKHALASMVPYANLQVQGTLNVGVVVKGRLDLTGTICDVKFPSSSEISFDSFPMDVDVNLNLDLTPLELKLAADLSISISHPSETVTKSLYNSNLWYYRTPSIHKKVLDVERKNEDTSVPQFITVEDDGRTNITSVVNCQVRQIPGLDYTDPRVEVIVDAGDDRSKVKLTLDIGTAPGLNDVKQDYEMGGPQIVIAETLSPTGVPLYFRVTAENTAGVTNFVTCSLPTYDVTLPNGRLTAEFKSSSNAHILKASAVIYEDSTLVSSRLAIGLGRNIYSDGVQGYQDVNFTNQNIPSYTASSDPLGETAIGTHFTGQKIGRLVVDSAFVVAELQNVSTPGLCAKQCMSYAATKCMSFNYDSNGDCQLLEAIESQTNALSLDGLHRHYERLAFGLASEFSFPIELTHNTLYYMVLHLTNSLGFQNLLSTDGTLVDLTPPNPGPINIQSDVYSITDCETNLPADRRNDWKIWCVGIDPTFNNHRTIIDDTGSMTLFNGHEPLVDLMYTKDNTYISANWDGIHDYESGILGYSFAVGTTICGEEIKPHHDPYKHLLPLDDDSQWTGIGVVELPEGKKLPDGQYYVTVRAINQVEYGGPLVTTICHSTPLAIDNSPPLVYEIYNIRYDDVTHDLTADFNATDPESGIKSVYMCLGLNALNCDILGWTQTPSLSLIQVNFLIPDGQRAWIRLRVTNNVDLRTDAVSTYPIVVDNGGPNAGTVYDGSVIGQDLVYSYVNDQFCANWENFYDAESGIAVYYGVIVASAGTTISNEVELANTVTSNCISLPPATLQHNNLYKYRLTAVNAGHKQLNTTVESNGVTIDLTNPSAGQVVDGQLGSFTDQVYSVSTSYVSAQWRNFADAESTIASYEVKVTKRGNLGGGSEQTVQDFVELDNYTTTVDYNHFEFQHRDQVKVKVKAVNGATASVEAQTNGIIIDLTPPVMTSLFDGNSGSDIKYTSSQGSLTVKFQFADAESGIERFKFQVCQTSQGSRHQHYPSSFNTWVEDTNSGLVSKTLTGFSMTGGSHYLVRVAAVNNAGAVATYDTDGVIFDSTAPSVSATKINAFSSESEVLIGGYAHQANTNGIKASWTASDPESGIQYYEVAVGTSQYGTNILSWRNVGRVTNQYIDGLSLSTTNTMTNSPIYYVTVRATNGAGQQSTPRTSNPVKVLQENRAGTVTDGPLNTNNLALAGIDDIDFQKDKTTVTAQFRGFASYVHGIVHFDWAVGTTPGGEEVQPFMTHGLMHDETETGVPGNGIATRGIAHAAFALQEGVTYYSTVRGITNDGTVLQATSNGFTVNNTPPTLSFVSYAQEGPDGSLGEGQVLYREDLDTLSADWLFSDAVSHVTNLTFKMGSFPKGDDLVSAVQMSSNELLIGEASMPGNQITPVDDGRANIITVSVSDEVGLTKTVVSSSVVIDKTAPSRGTLTCPAYIQSHNPIECSWEGFHDAESPIVGFNFEITVGESLSSIHSSSMASSVTSYITPSLHGTVKHGYTYFAIVTATNQLGMSSSATSDPIRIDSTAPVVGTVVEVSNSYQMYFNDSSATNTANVFICNSTANCTAMDTTCQESLTSVYVAWTDFDDPETGIVAYQIAVGTSAGGGQIRAYFNVPVSKHYYQVKGLNLNGYRQIFVSVKAFNGAGMATVATSNGVFLSYISQGITPPAPFSVWDQDSTDGDIDYQTSRTTITARWNVSGDPCPVLKYEWAIERIDGLRVQEYYDTNGQNYGLNDDLTLYGIETYYQLLRVTTAMNNFTYTLRSDGVTVVDQPLYPGFVYDGDVTAIDLQYQPFKNRTSANWEGFGEKYEIINSSIQVISGNAGVIKQERPPNQEIVRYEVAVGTDRRFETTRDDIVAWTDVGLNTSVTFYDLDLVVETAVYYFSVRAYSTANTMAEVTSNGFSVRDDVGVTGGSIVIGDYVNASTVLPLKWEGFQSNVEILIYYVALSSSSVPTIDCDHVLEGGPMLDTDRLAIFDIVDRTNIGEDTFTVITGLNLTQDTDYWVSVIAVDEAAKCKIITKQIHTDTTVPLEGKMKNGPYYDMSMSYTPHLRDISLQWVNYSDAESGLDTIQLDLYRKMSCNPSEPLPDQLVKTVTIAGSYLTYTFLDLDLNASEPYYVIMTVYNRARLSITTTSPVILLDTSINTAGTIIDGINLLADQAWAGSQSEVKATFLYLPESLSSICLPQNLLNDDTSWKTLSSDINNDHSGRLLDLILRDANVQRTALNPADIVIKLARDTSTNDMYSGAIYRDAELAFGGTYEMDMKAAASDQAVTSVLFWDGPEDYLTQFDYTVPNTTPFCSCCDDPVPTSDCQTVCGGCSTYVANRLVTGRRKRSVNQIMQLTSQQRQSLVNSGNINSITATASSNPSQPACGMQVYKDGASAGRIVLWATFSTEYSYEPRHEEFTLDFDPSAAFHHYSIEMYSVADEAAHPTWCMEVAIDNQPSEISLCGLPELSSNATFVMTVWNWKNYVPSINSTSVFATLWDVQATFRNVTIPASAQSMCRYESPFRGSNDGVLSFEAGIGTDDLLDDIVPFSRVHDPCIPCKDQCNAYHCNATCSATEMGTVTLTLSGLNLPLNFTDASGQSKPRTYYFTVRAMLASGLNAIASSDGFNIDVTPPDFDTSAFNYLDTSHTGEIRPATHYLGSSSTIKCAWECEDKESDIVGYTWAIGTMVGGSEIQNATSVGVTTEGINGNLTGILTDGVTYYVTVTCTNGAGLTTTYTDSNGITVSLTPPNISSVGLSMVGMSSIAGNAIPATSRKLNSQNSFELDFTVDPDPTINEYYFKICSENTECDDIFERTLVSNRDSARLRIYNGRLYKDGQSMFELQQVQKTYNSSLASAVNSDAFHMEPGRQIFPYIDACNEAQCSTKSFGSILISNARTQTRTSTAGESVTASLLVSYNTGRRKRSASGIDVTSPSGMAPGQTISMTELTNADMVDSYNSAAGSGFVPLITSPSHTTSDSTYLERILYNRVSYHSSNDESFLLSSIGDYELPGPLTINYPYTPADTVNTWLLLHWNPSVQKWQLSHETCPYESNTYTEDSITSTITIKVCNTRGNDTHNGTYTYFREDTQFLLTNVQDLIPNTAPQLNSSTTYSMLEDAGTLVFQLNYIDSEGDTVTFAADDGVTFPSNMNAEFNISTNGLMLFTPCTDCFGDFKKVITIAEDPITGIPTMTSTSTLTITVNSVNDAPVAFAYLNGVNLLSTDPTIPVEVLLEEKRFNTTDNTNYTFIFGAYDYDNYDSLSVVLSNPTNGTLTAVSTSTTPPTCSATGIPCNSMGLAHSASSITWVYTTYNYVPDDDFWGIDPAQIYVSDSNSSLTNVVTMSFSLMARPCENLGVCAVPANATGYTCQNVYRAQNFDTYYVCDCPSGFEGTYCQFDVDECATSTCKSPYVCVDGANGFTCQCPSNNPDCDGLEGWMIGVAVVGALLFLLLIIPLWYFFAVRRGHVVWSNLFKRNKYRRRSLDSSSDSVADRGKNYNFATKSYVIEAQDEDGFNNVFDKMKSSESGKMSGPSIVPSAPPISLLAGGTTTAAIAPATSAAKAAKKPPKTSRVAESKPEPPKPITKPTSPPPIPPFAAGTTTATAPAAASLMDPVTADSPETQLPAQETISPPASHGSYLPRRASATSLSKSAKMRRSSTSSWLNSLLNMTDSEIETPSSRPITPVEFPEKDEEEQDDDEFFFT